jgi:tripartite-type tricarboxylate transporter receptor subunit TctC
MELGYTRDSFVPLIPVARTSFVLVARRAVGIETYDQFYNHVVTNPEQFTLGFWHEPTRRVIDRWVEQAGLPVPKTQAYTGSTTQAEAIGRGLLDYAFDTWVAAKANPDVVVLAVLDQEGRKPGITCLSDLYPGIDIDNWYGIVAPAGMKPELMAQLQKTLEEGFKQTKYQQRLLDLEFRPWAGNAGDFTEQQTKTIEFYQNLK